MSARKDDKGKPPVSLIPRSALLAEARVMAHGKATYEAHNWRKGMAWSRVIDAAMRHIMAFADGEDFDNGERGSGELHLANARCCLAFLIEYHEKGLGQDDRFKQPEVDSFSKSIHDAWLAGSAALADMGDVKPEPVLPRFSLLARGYREPPFSLGQFYTEMDAQTTMQALAPEWPTFTLYIVEEPDGRPQTT